MGADIDYSITVREVRRNEDGSFTENYRNLPILEDDFYTEHDVGFDEKSPNRPKYRRSYFRNSLCFQFIRDNLIHEGRHPNGNYAVHPKSEDGKYVRDESGNVIGEEWPDDYGRGWFTLKELKKAIKSRKLAKEFMGDDPDEFVHEDYDGIIHCLKMMKKDIVRNVIGFTFDDCYVPSDENVIICVMFNC